jgi:hypothetical protein
MKIVNMPNAKRDERRTPGNPVVCRTGRYRRRKFHYSCITSFVCRIVTGVLKKAFALSKNVWYNTAEWQLYHNRRADRVYWPSLALAALRGEPKGRKL